MTHAPDRTVTWRLIATIGAVALVALATSAVANATTKITVDSGWQSFITGGGIDGGKDRVEVGAPGV